MTNTDIIIDLIRDLQREDIPDNIVVAVKACVLDYLGVAFAGAHDLERKIQAYLDMKPEKKGGSVVIGMNKNASMEDAALINGISSHYFELDDGSRFGMVHLGAPVLSALFAVAGAYKVSGERFIRAVLVGYEVTNRLASAIQPEHKKRGFHTTGTCGCIGAAAAMATALDFDELSLKNTIAAAVASASGLLEMIEDTSQLKPFNAGKAAQNAVTSALIGKSGFSGPVDPVGGKRGFLNVMANGINYDWFERKEGKRFSILEIYKKPYASCRHCHSAVEAALAMSSEIDPRQIERIDVFTYGLAVFGHDHTEISGVGAAKMSIPYSVAAAICLHTGGMQAMSEEAVQNQGILQLAKKVHVIEKQEFSALVPAKRIAEVEISLDSGQKCCRKVEYPKGEPENPISEKELKDKFMQLAMYAGKSEQYCLDIIDHVYHLEDSFQKLLQLL